MKYTRYNVRPKNKSGGNFLFYLAVILVLALILGTGIQSIARKTGTLWYRNEVAEKDKEKIPQKAEETPVEDEEKTGEVDGKEVIPAGRNMTFYLVQCGVFKVKDNAAGVIGKMQSSGIPFTIEEGELTKVYYGIFKEENLSGALEKLKEIGVESSKITINILMEDDSRVQLCESMDGLLQIGEKLKDSSVKSIKTMELKNWCNSLEDTDESLNSHEDLSAIKAYISELPEDLDRAGFEAVLKYIYEIIIKYKK